LLTPYILIHKVLIPDQCFQIHIATFHFIAAEAVLLSGSSINV